jgi:anti-anti-sigma factor
VVLKMAVSMERGGAGWVVRMTGEMGAAEAQELKDGLLAQLGQAAGEAGPVLLDLSAVELLDVCCLQVIMAAWRGAREAGIPMCVGGVSVAAQETIELAGVAGLGESQWPPAAETAPGQQGG